MRNTIYVLAILTLLIACGTPPQSSMENNHVTSPDQGNSKPQPTTAADSLINRQWILERFGPSDQPSTPLAGTTITATFHDDGKLDGSSGCNSYFATYTRDGQRLSIDQPGRTLIGCAEPITQQETRFLESLIFVESFTVADDKLTIAYQGGELHFTAAPPVTDLPLTGTLWQLTTFVQPGIAQSTVTGTSVTATFKDDGTVGGTTGCNHYGGKYITDGPQITISEVMQTMRGCIDQNVMDQETRYLTALRAATAWTITGSTLVLTYEGGEIHFTAQPSASP
jgi:heat shock protein HslJ